MSGIRHWTPACVKRRARQVFYAFRGRRERWLCPDAIRFLSGWLGACDVGFQWGSGPGTFWLAKRVRRLTCVEHDPARAREIQARLEALGLDERVTYHLESHGNAMESTDAAYVRMIDSVLDYSLDFCLVGGPLPLACALASILKLRYGGLLILENADRYLSHESELAACQPAWEDIIWHLALWRQIWSTNGTSETAIFVKP